MGRREVKKRKNPKYTHEFTDQGTGKARYYLRVPGRKLVPLPGLPWSPEFMEAREKALKDDWVAPQLGAARTRPGTVNAAIVSYYQSSAFTDGLAKSSQGMRRNILERFREAHGDKRIALLHKKAVQAILNKKTPAAASNWRKAFRGFIDHCLALDLIAVDPLAGVKLVSVKSTSSPLGAGKSVPSSRPAMRSAPERGLRMSCCCRSDSRAAMS
jgi:hypothetical protein